MPHARNIKPKLFLNEILGKADPNLTILFASLWCLADKAGRLEDRHELIKAQTFPYKIHIKVDELLTNLYEMGFISRYKIDGKQYIQVIEFKKHQRPHHTEKESDLPECSPKYLIPKGEGKLNGKSTLNHGELTSLERSDSLIVDSLIPDSLIPDSKTYATAIQKNLDRNFENFWLAYPKRPGANKTQAAKAWRARMNEGASIQDIAYGTKRYRDYCEAMQIEPQFIKQASTFLGPNKHYLDDWIAAGKQNARQNFADRLTGKNGDDDEFTIEPA